MKAIGDTIDISSTLTVDNMIALSEVMASGHTVVINIIAITNAETQ